MKGAVCDPPLFCCVKVRINTPDLEGLNENNGEVFLDGTRGGTLAEGEEGLILCRNAQGTNTQGRNLLTKRRSEY